MDDRSIDALIETENKLLEIRSDALLFNVLLFPRWWAETANAAGLSTCSREKLSQEISNGKHTAWSTPRTKTKPVETVFSKNNQKDFHTFQVSTIATDNGIFTDRRIKMKTSVQWGRMNLHQTSVAEGLPGTIPEISWQMPVSVEAGKTAPHCHCRQRADHPNR